MKQYAVRLVQELSMLSGRALRRALAVKRPRVLMYHAVGSQGVDADLFAWQLDLLAREFEPLSLPALLDRLSRDECTGNEVAITFDDGVRNHLTAAYPALQAAGVPATFFVCPGLVESGQWIWNMEARARLRMLSTNERRQLALRLHWPTDDIEGIITWAKILAMPERQVFEQSVRNGTRQFEPSAEQLDLFSPLTWREIEALDPGLITIGSHTVSHPILTTLDAAEQALEISASRQLLEQRLGREVDLFCYPNGGNDEGVVEHVRRHYRWAVTTEEDFLRPDMDPCLLPRVPAAPNHALFMQRLHKPTS